MSVQSARYCPALTGGQYARLRAAISRWSIRRAFYFLWGSPVAPKRYTVGATVPVARLQIPTDGHWGNNCPYKKICRGDRPGRPCDAVAQAGRCGAAFEPRKGGRRVSAAAAGGGRRRWIAADSGAGGAAPDRKIWLTPVAVQRTSARGQ